MHGAHLAFVCEVVSGVVGRYPNGKSIVQCRLHALLLYALVYHVHLHPGPYRGLLRAHFGHCSVESAFLIRASLALPLLLCGVINQLHRCRRCCPCTEYSAEYIIPEGQLHLVVQIV